MTTREFLRLFRPLPFLPCWFLERGYPRLAYQPAMALWGKALGAVLNTATQRCWLRSEHDVYMPAATFASTILRAGDVFVDVGAYDGLVSLVAAAAVGPAGRVYAFEPNPAAFAKIQCIIRGYQLARVHLENCAVSSNDGAATLYVPQNAAVGYFTTLTEKSAVKTDFVSQPCRVQTLDGFWRQQRMTDPPTLLKIDVEGAEFDVLAGAATLLASPRPPMIVFEASDSNASGFGRTVDDVLDMLAKIGYQFWILRYPELTPIRRAADINPAGETELWTDVLALKPAHHQVALDRLRRRLNVVGGSNGR